MLEELEAEELEFETVGEFLAEIKKEFGRGEEKLVKSGRIEEAGARRKDDGRICSGV